MTFNVYFAGDFVTTNLFDIAEEKLVKLIDAYKRGDSAITLSGRRYPFNQVYEFKIYMNESGLDHRQIEERLEKSNSYSKSIGGRYVNAEILRKLGAEITDKKLGDLSYGCEKTVSVIGSKDNYVNLERLTELRNTSSQVFDLSKLVRLCEELNSNWASKNFFTVGLLVRSIINHVPPIFGYQTFDQVTAEFGGQSFKKNMGNLNQSLRSIADSYTHQTIRKKEVLPNETQIDFRQNLDFMLSEIIARLHT